MAANIAQSMVPPAHDLSHVEQIITSMGSESRQPQALEMIQEDIKSEGADTSLTYDVLHTGTNVTTNASHEVERQWSDSENEPEAVDISMWTQIRPDLSSSHRLLASDRDKNPQVPVSDDPGRSVNDTQSEPPESEIDEVLFTLHERAHTDTTSKTTSHNPSVRHEIVRHSLNIEPQEIVFIEGSPSLQYLPQHLHEQLKLYCRARGTDYPEVIKTKWPRSGVYRTAQGHHTWFETPRNNAQLSAARYQYGMKGQFIVVRDETGHGFNGGKAVIVLHDPSKAVNRDKNGLSCTLHQWHVWDPFGELPQPLWCWKVIAMQQTGHKSKANTHAVPSSPQVKHKPVTGDESTGATPAKRVRASEPTNFLQDEDAAIALGGTKRPSSTSESERTTKKISLSSGNTDRIFSLVDQPIAGHVGARRDQASGEIWLRRKSDNRMVVLRCTECEYAGCQTQQGLYNHLRMVHDINLTDRDAVGDHCGILVDEKALKKGNIVLLERPQETKTLVDASSRTRSSQRTMRRLATPSPSVDPHDGLNHEAQFVFMKAPDDLNPRARSLGTVNTAEKLFVNALVAGVAKKDTLMLTVTVEKDQPFHVVKNDKEDFALIVQRVKESKSKNPTVTVTVEDWSD